MVREQTTDRVFRETGKPVVGRGVIDHVDARFACLVELAAGADQVIGQSIGLPIPMALVSFISIAVTGATVVIFGKAIWEPTDLAAERWQTLYRSYREKQLAWREHYKMGGALAPEAVCLYAEMTALQEQMAAIEGKY